jgi:hypothetical protein
MSALIRLLAQPPSQGECAAFVRSRAADDRFGDCGGEKGKIGERPHPARQGETK